MAFTDPMFQLGMRLTMQYNDRFVEMTAPEYWACYFIYGDPGACVSGGTVVDYIVEVKTKETSNV